ncbi:MAG TPA: acetate--CoA ligase family protein, partial [Pirellulales bacterium]
MLEACVEMDSDASSRRLTNSPDAAQRLAAWLALIPDPLDDKPAEAESSEKKGEARAASPHAYQGLSLIELLPRLTLRLQRSANGRPTVRHGFTQATGKPGHYRVSVEFEEESLVRLALDSARRMCLALASRGDYDAEAELSQLRLFVDDYCLGPSTLSIIDAARRRNIPARRLNENSLVQLGHGIHRRRMLTAETDRTSMIAEAIAQDKELTKRLLQAVGVPVPAGRVVADAADAWTAACEIGLPVVVKPRDANHGRGVSLNLNLRHQIEAAYALAVVEGSGVIVESWARGAEHRLLIVAGQLVAASRGEPEQVVGDGQHTVTELVDQLNQDPRRGVEFIFPLGKVLLDALGLLTLEQQGYQPDSVPPAGTTVLIHPNGDFTTDETDEVHPDVAAQAVLAAQVIGLDVAGIDVIATSIARPLREQGGVVTEVNAGPGLRMHLEPLRGRPRAVGEIILQSMFPAGQTGRIPTVAVCGPGSEVTASLVSRLLGAAGFYVGLASPDALYVNERRLDSASGPRPQQQRSILLHPRLSAAVFESTPATLLEGGLAFDQCDVAILGAAAEPGAVRSSAEPVVPAADRLVPGTLARV